MSAKRSPWKSVLLHATLVTASIIAIAPIAWVFLTSLKPRDAWQSSRVTLFDRPSLDNYTQLLADTNFLRWMMNSVVVSLFTTLIAVGLAATTGYALSRLKFPGHRSFAMSLLVVQMFPAAILIVPFYNLMAKLGLLNSYAGLVLAYVTVAVPFCAWMLRGYFATIPVEIDEAGLMDGLSPFGAFVRLILPLARPGIAVAAFYSFLTAWGEVAYATTFLVGDEKLTLAAGLQQFVGQFKAEWGLMTAAAVLITIPAAVVFLTVQRNLVAGLTAGGTKS
ncbi:carbohydrate ABC transporter permease [Luedemannella helvata]|uniref:ABC transporter permease subunit n=1 Tax=Luedemannella helvata TaxID=349315 RepID=A0ABN2JPR4_9ACTN